MQQTAKNLTKAWYLKRKSYIGKKNMKSHKEIGFKKHEISLGHLAAAQKHEISQAKYVAKSMNSHKEISLGNVMKSNKEIS